MTERGSYPHAASHIIGRTDNDKNCLDESANQLA
jgi:hypothetical protein